MKKIVLLPMLFILAMVGCRQDKEIINEKVIIDSEPAVYINTSITGVVSDEDGNPLEGVLITVEQRQTSTDDNGFFYLKDIQANQNGASVQADKSGYFATSKLIYPQLNRVEFVKITMLSSDEGGRFQSAGGGAIPLPQGARINFPPNALMLNGSLYDGEVVVFARYLDPEDEDLEDKMPGSLIGIDGEGIVRGMETFGMIGAELQSSNGEALELAPGMKATLTFPLSANLEARAEDRIALWHFDEPSGYWAQEGEAIKQGNTYVAEVEHFSFWNCDAPFDLVNVKGRVETPTGQAVSNTRIEIIRKNANTRETGSGFTDYTGGFRGKVPSFEDLELNVYNLCDELIYSEDVGPLYADTDLGTYEVTFPNQVNVQGNLVNCDFEPVTNGYALIQTNEARFMALVDADGSFSATVGVCNENEITVVGLDLDNLEKSGGIIFAYDDNIDVGEIQACGLVVYTMNLDIDGEGIVLENCFSRYIPDTAGIPGRVYVGAEGGQGYANVIIGSDGVGTGVVVQFDVGLLAFPNVRFEEIQMTGTITQFDPAPSVVRGDFSGTAFNSNSGQQVEIFGNFAAERK